jgi:hypothetical protein
MRLQWGSWLLSFTLFLGIQPAHDSLGSKSEVIDFLNELFVERSQILIKSNPESISHYYIADSQTSQNAYKHEAKRVAYLQAWAKIRGVNFTKAESIIRISHRAINKGIAKVSLVNSMQLTYQYLDDKSAIQQFGLGTQHGITLKKMNGEWHIYSEWYSDPLDEDAELISVHSDIKKPSQFTAPQKAQKTYNREQAIDYADKYAGAAWGAGNERKYNNKYRNYSNLGGDCTNFASQVIADSSEGGGLPMTSTWFYQKNAGGSEAWIRTDSLKYFLVNRGYGRIIASGGFKQLSELNSRNPQGAFANLNLGDLITYEMKGDVDHFAILTGWDPKGYPLVNSHSTDRFHVPLDLGWDKYTRFSLIHIN